MPPEGLDDLLDWLGRARIVMSPDASPKDRTAALASLQEETEKAATAWRARDAGATDGDGAATEIALKLAAVGLGACASCGAHEPLVAYGVTADGWYALCAHCRPPVNRTRVDLERDLTYADLTRRFRVSTATEDAIAQVRMEREAEREAQERDAGLLSLLALLDDQQRHETHDATME